MDRIDRRNLRTFRRKNFGDVAHFFYPPTVFLFSFPTTHLFIGCYDHSSFFLHPSPFGFISPVHRSRLSRFNFFGRPKRNVLPTPTFFIVIPSFRPWCLFFFFFLSTGPDFFGSSNVPRSRSQVRSNDFFPFFSFFNEDAWGKPPFTSRFTSREKESRNHRKHRNRDLYLSLLFFSFCFSIVLSIRCILPNIKDRATAQQKPWWFRGLRDTQNHLLTRPFLFVVVCGAAIISLVVVGCSLRCRR